MEDSGHGQDIGGSDTLLGDSRAMDTSEEEEEEKTSKRASRRPRRSRVSYKVGVGSRKIKVRSLGKEQEEGGSGASSDSEGEIFSSSSAAEGLSSRDLSPVEIVREYIQ